MTSPQIHLPRVVIEFCVKCKWNLRAAYYAQELLQTFCSPPSEVTLGEISLVPVTGGIFTVTLHHLSPSNSDSASTTTPTTSTAISQNNATLSQLITTQVWDRKADGGFPETKELKNRIRNLIDPSRDMGHIDRSLRKGKPETETGGPAISTAAATETRTESETPLTVREATQDDSNQQSLHQHKLESKAEGDLAKRKTEEEDIADCEECRLVARESLEDQLGRITSNSTQI